MSPYHYLQDADVRTNYPSCTVSMLCAHVALDPKRCLHVAVDLMHCLHVALDPKRCLHVAVDPMHCPNVALDPKRFPKVLVDATCCSHDDVVVVVFVVVVVVVVPQLVWPRKSAPPRKSKCHSSSGLPMF